MNLSPQAIFKIRSKLEGVGIIKGYTPIVDYKKIGISVMMVLVIRIRSKVWGMFADDQISERIANSFYVLDAFRVSEEQTSHILVLGFRDIEHKERFITQIQTKLADEIQIKDVYTFSVDKIVTRYSMGLLHEVLDKKEFSLQDLFLP